MTVTEAHIAFKIEVDKNANNIGMSGCPSFLPEEIDYWLNSALISKVSTKFTGNNPLRTAFEGSSKRVADLEKLVKTDKSLDLLAEFNTNRLILNEFTSGVTHGSKAQEKRMFFINGLLRFTGRSAWIQLISHENANKFLETYTNKPWIENPVAVLENDTLIIYVDKDLMVGPYELDLTYLAYPRIINNDDITSGMEEIPEYMQYEVIKLAADMAIDNIESPRTQTHPPFIQVSE